MRKKVLFLLGLFLPVSHVMTIPISMTFKIPEILLLVFFLVCLIEFRVPKGKGPNILLLCLGFCFLILPLLSNILSAFLYSDMVLQGAKAMGAGLDGGRKSASMAPWFMLAWNGFSFLTVYHLCSSSEEEVKSFYRPLYFSVMVLAVYSIYDGAGIMLKGLPDFPWFGDQRHSYQGQLRARGFFIEPLNLAHFMIYAIPLYLGRDYVFTRKAWNYFLKFLGVAVVSVATVLSFSTSGLLSLTMGFICTAILFRKFSFKQIALIIGIFSGLVSMSFLHPLTRTYFIHKIIHAFANPNVVGPTLLDRIFKIKSGINIFLEHPIFGTGLGTSGLLYPLFKPPEAWMIYRGVPFPLNEYVRLAAETGLLGVLSFIVFSIVYTLYLKKNEEFLSRSEVLLYAGGFFGTLFASMFSGLFNVYFIWIFVGLSIASIQNRKSKCGVLVDE